MNPGQAMVFDGLTPKSVERPTTPEELARHLAGAAAAGLTVIPVGGARAMGMGNPPARVDLALRTTGLCRILEHSQADLTVTVEAGVTLEELAAELELQGQFLPVDPFGAPGHTVGGLIACGWSGPLRLRYGSPRDLLIGLRVALPNGELARSGGKVVKNVSGYDLNKLHLGALGTLGVIVEASFKVFPRPLHEVTLRRDVDGAGALWAEAERALDLLLPPIALELLSPAAGGWALVARMAGTGRAVDRMVDELGWMKHDGGFWGRHAQLRSAAWARLSVPPRRLREVTGKLPPGSRWIAQPGIGTAHWLDAETASSVASVRSAAEAAGGSLVLLDASTKLRAEVGAWGRPPAALGLMRELKRAFDPHQTLNPGRFLF